MKLRRQLLALTFAVIAAVGLSRGVKAAQEDMHITNETGHTVAVFLFQDDKVHTNSTGGTQFGMLKDGESKIAHVPACKFSILLLDGQDIWHAEFHDCHSDEMVFHSDTGHGTKK